MKNLRGLATGIGSLPHKEAESALDLIFQYTPHIPFWPQLPKRDIRERMVAQFSEGLPCLEVTKDGLFLNLQDKEKKLEIFYEKLINDDREYFKVTQDFALGLHKFYQRLENSDLKDIQFIKCQLTGPFTFAAGIKDDKGIAFLHDAIFMQAILKGLAMKALWQIRFFKKFGKRIILFLDEPYLGCFGSAYTPINREDVVRGLEELCLGIKSEEVLLGLHCCGNTDWSIFTDVSQIGIINFDAFGFLERFLLYVDNLKAFLKRGGIICWGIVPTQDFTGQEAADTFLKKIQDGIKILTQKGIDKELLLENLWISPSCGLGALDIQKSEKIFKLLSETASSIRKTLT